jgi:hypothetical protein
MLCKGVGKSGWAPGSEQRRTGTRSFSPCRAHQLRPDAPAPAACASLEQRWTRRLRFALCGGPFAPARVGVSRRLSAWSLLDCEPMAPGSVQRIEDLNAGPAPGASKPRLASLGVVCIVTSQTGPGAFRERRWRICGRSSLIRSPVIKFRSPCRRGPPHARRAPIVLTRTGASVLLLFVFSRGFRACLF